MNATLIKSLGGAAAIALVAGTIHSQQVGNQQQVPAQFEPVQTEYRDAGEWVRADFIPALSDSVLLLTKKNDDYDVKVEIIHGEVEATLDGDTISTEQVKQKGDQLRVLDDEGETIAEFTLPDLERLRQAHLTRPGQFADDREVQERFLGIMEEEENDFARDRQVRPDQRGIGQDDRRMPMVDLRTSAVGILMFDAMPHHLQDTDYRSGVYIDAVQHAMPAYEAGLERGDIIVEVQGRSGVTPDRLKNFLRNVPPGETISFKVIRNGDEEEYEVTTTRIVPTNVNWDYIITGIDDRELRRQQMSLERDRQIRGFKEGRIFGFGISEVEDELERVDDYEKGLKLTHVAPGTILHDAGLRRGDVILEVEGKKDLMQEDLKELLKDKEPGDSIELKVLRNGDTHDLNIRILPHAR